MYRLSLFREAINQHEKSLKLCEMDETALHLNKCYLRLDQPLLAAQMFNQMAKKNPGVHIRYHLPHTMATVQLLIAEQQEHWYEHSA